ncbi:helix-turn-helix domain-containing protein [Paraburkholderia sp. GAS334]|uniref:helix-turn-helix domain-containing protein n=1 Tax=Paraburkholderia sp. GAS334 TaxID=3035131 RepID=UPI003D1DCC34
MAQRQKTATPKSAAKEILKPQSSGNDSAAQRGRVLEFLRRHGSLSTLDARHLLDCMHPAMRVLELRRQGHEIVTAWSHEATPEGGEHRVARYHLVREVVAC